MPISDFCFLIICYYSRNDRIASGAVNSHRQRIPVASSNDPRSRLSIYLTQIPTSGSSLPTDEAHRASLSLLARLQETTYRIRVVDETNPFPNTNGSNRSTLSTGSMDEPIALRTRSRTRTNVEGPSPRVEQTSLR